jgi:hypothetical protein
MANGISQLENRDWRIKQNLQVDGFFVRSPGRYYLEDFFVQRPGLNGDLDQVYTVEVARSLSKNFEVLGTHAVTACSVFSTTEAGVVLTTAGADDDQVIVCPHLDTDQTAWTSVKWGTENQTVWEGTIMTGASVAAVLIWAGLKLTNTPTIATDADQVFFRFSTDDVDTKWTIESSIGNVDTATVTALTVEASTTYRFRIEIGSDRKAACYINDVFYYKTAALTNDVDFIPYIGVMQLAGSTTKAITVCYEKISRILFE